MNLPLELHVALARLDADLSATRRSIQALMECCFPQSPDGVGGVQYRVLEDAIQQPRQAVAATACGNCTEPILQPAIRPNAQEAPRTAQASNGLVPLGIGRWALRENGWTLAFPDGHRCLPLSADERAILLHLAQSSEHRISGSELIRLVGLTAKDRETRTEDAEPHVRVIGRLRRRVRAIGASLPLRAMRGGGYQLARTVAVPIDRRRKFPVAVVHRAPEIYDAGRSGAMGMSQ